MKQFPNPPYSLPSRPLPLPSSPPLQFILFPFSPSFPSAPPLPHPSVCAFPSFPTTIAFLKPSQGIEGVWRALKAPLWDLWQSPNRQQFWRCQKLKYEHWWWEKIPISTEDTRPRLSVLIISGSYVHANQSPNYVNKLPRSCTWLKLYWNLVAAWQKCA